MSAPEELTVEQAIALLAARPQPKGKQVRRAESSESAAKSAEGSERSGAARGQSPETKSRRERRGGPKDSEWQENRPETQRQSRQKEEPRPTERPHPTEG